MDYFRIKIDESLSSSNAIKLPPLTNDEIGGSTPIVKKILINQGMSYTIPQDYLSTFSVRNQYHIISDNFKKLICIYEKNLNWIPFILIDQFQSQYLYWYLSIDVLDCISNMTTYNHDKTINDLVLVSSKLEKKSIFFVQSELQKILVVNLDLAESILRRNFYGIGFVKLKQEVN